MMVSFLGTLRQVLHVMFLLRYLVVQPAWVGFKAFGLYLLLDLLVSLLAAL
jgi:hypothetical protein